MSYRVPELAMKDERYLPTRYFFIRLPTKVDKRLSSLSRNALYFATFQKIKNTITVLAMAGWCSKFKILNCVENKIKWSQHFFPLHGYYFVLVATQYRTYCYYYLKGAQFLFYKMLKSLCYVCYVWLIFVMYDLWMRHK